MIVVQKLVTRWTKRSRGAPEAEVRSAVPMSYELAPPTSPPAGALLLHLVEHVESRAFAPVAKVLVIPLAALAAHQSTVLNIGFGELAADTFQATAPIDVVDVRARLR